MTLPPMGGCDWTLIGIVFVLGLYGAFKGLIRETLGLMALAGAALLARLFQPLAAPLLVSLLPNPELARAAALSLVFTLSLVVLHLVGGILSRVLKLVCPFTVVNRLGGLTVGIIKGGAAVVMLLLVLRALPVTQPWVDESRLAPYFAPVVDLLEGQVRERIPIDRLIPKRLISKVAL